MYTIKTFGTFQSVILDGISKVSGYLDDLLNIYSCR